MNVIPSKLNKPAVDSIHKVPSGVCASAVTSCGAPSRPVQAVSRFARDSGRRENRALDAYSNSQASECAKQFTYRRPENEKIS